MNQHTIRAPFFEIGPKSYLYGQDVVDLAIAADKASEKYGVDIIFTTPIVSISAVKAATKHIHVFAPHMDPLEPGRGLADILPESLVAAGAEGVMLNHVEKPLTLGVLKKTIERAKEVGLTTIVCADSIVEASMIAKLDPDIIVAEPSELIGTGLTSGPEYVEAASRGVKEVNPDILVLTAAGISNGQDVVDLAIAADKASEKYGVDIIFTTPIISISAVKAATKHIHVFAPHMDPLEPGRGLADILPESLVAAGAEGVMLNHVEKPLTLGVLKKTIERAKEVGLTTIVCADSIVEASMIARLDPDIIVAEPSELIGTGLTSGPEYVEAASRGVKEVNPDILVLTAAGISNGQDVYNTIIAGADATGSSSGVAKAADRAAMVDEMIAAVRKAWDERHTK